MEFDRLGVFKYSEEEGTSAALDYEDNIPPHVKQNRYDELMMLQQKINLNKNIDRIGKNEKVIVDIVSEEGWSLARSYRDAPEIDNYVRIDEYVPEGQFVNIEYIDAFEYDLLAKRV